MPPRCSKSNFLRIRPGIGLPALYPSNMPARVAVISVASEPPSTAFSPSAAMSFLRCGAMGAMPPIWMAIEEKLAKPHMA